MNEYLKDATHWLRRASEALGRVESDPSHDRVHDATLFFAFGIEKMFKGILWDINPLFIMEETGFANACGVLYRDRLLEAPKTNADKEDKKNAYKRNVLPFLGSMHRAKEFSKTVAAHVSVFCHLSDLRGILAHRTLKEYKGTVSQKFLLRVYHPIVTQFIAELSLDAAECFDGLEASLKEASEQECELYEFDQQLEQLIAKHQACFEKRKNDPAVMAKARELTTAALVNDPKADKRHYAAKCPSCSHRALLLTQKEEPHIFDDEFYQSEYIIAMECRYCGLELTDAEAMDRFGLQYYLERPSLSESALQ